MADKPKAPERKTVVFSIRIDERIVYKLNVLSDSEDRKRNWMIEQILAEKTGVILR